MTRHEFNIHKVNHKKGLPEISKLIDESCSEGFRFLRRLESDYKSGSNRFSLEGEGLWYVTDPLNEVVAIGGVNRQEVGGSSAGRLRRFYVRRADRGKGIGTLLLDHMTTSAAESCDLLVLFTDTEAAGRFYEYHGFLKSDTSGDFSHYKPLKSN